MTNILSAIDAAEYLIAHNASHVVKQVRGYARSHVEMSLKLKTVLWPAQETRGYMQSLVGYFRQYTQWVKNSVSMTRPLALEEPALLLMRVHGVRACLDPAVVRRGGPV